MRAGRLLLVGLALFSVGCGLDVGITADPPQAHVNGPLSFKVDIHNPEDCTLESGSALLGFLIVPEEQADTVCSLSDVPERTFCELLVALDAGSEAPRELFGFCCQDQGFEDAHPELCEDPIALDLSPAGVRAAAIDFIQREGIAGTARIVDSNPAPANVCSPVSDGFFSCDLDDISPGETSTLTFEMTPTQSGRFLNLAFVFGEGDCFGTLLPGGSACTTTLVAETRGVPLASGAALAVLAAGLAAAGTRAVRRRRRR
jgi:hypothetical protein